MLNSGGWDDFRELVELLNCPATTTMAARSAFDNHHPNYLFGMSNGALTARQEADVILALGTRLGTMDLPYARYFGDPGFSRNLSRWTSIPRNIGVNRPVDMAIVADAKATASALLEELKRMDVKPCGWRTGREVQGHGEAGVRRTRTGSDGATRAA